MELELGHFFFSLNDLMIQCNLLCTVILSNFRRTRTALEMARRSFDHFRFFHINFLKQMQSKKFFLNFRSYFLSFKTIASQQRVLILKKS